MYQCVEESGDMAIDSGPFRSAMSEPAMGRGIIASVSGDALVSIAADMKAAHKTSKLRLMRQLFLKAANKEEELSAEDSSEVRSVDLKLTTLALEQSVTVNECCSTDM